MSFIREELSKEKGEELYEKYGFTNPFNNRPGRPYPVRPSYWSADNDSGAFIIGLGTNNLARDGRPPVTRATLVWQEKKIELEYYWDRDKSSNQATRVVQKIVAPSELLDGDTKPKLEELVKDAVESYEIDSGDHVFKYQQLNEPVAAQ